MSQLSGLARRLVSELGMGDNSRLSTEGSDGGVANWNLNEASMAPMAQQTSGLDDMGEIHQRGAGTSGVMKPRKLGSDPHVSHESVWAGDVLGELIQSGAGISSGLRMVLERHGGGSRGTTEAAAAGGGEGGSPPQQPSLEAASPSASLSRTSPSVSSTSVREPSVSSTSSAIKVRAITRDS